MNNKKYIPKAGDKCELHRKNEPIEIINIKFIDEEVIFYNLVDEPQIHCHAPLSLVDFKQQPSEEAKMVDEACKVIDGNKTCQALNINIDCSAAQKSVIQALIKAGWHNQPKVEAVSYREFYGVFSTSLETFNYLEENKYIIVEDEEWP